jgi:hypothetical protein
MHHVRSSRGLRFADRAMDLAEVTELIARSLHRDCVPASPRGPPRSDRGDDLHGDRHVDRGQPPPNDNAAVEEDSYDASSGGET